MDDFFDDVPVSEPEEEQSEVPGTPRVGKRVSGWSFDQREGRAVSSKHPQRWTEGQGS